MNEYTMLVPCRLNDGKKVSRKKFDWLEKNMLQSFGGFTNTGTVQGSWINEEGRLFRDKNRRYAVACNDITTVEELAKIVARKWEQEAIYIAQTATNVEFIQS